jgi:hypothetical protein
LTPPRKPRSIDTVELVCVPSGVRNFTVGDPHLYVLANDGRVRRTAKLELPWSQWDVYAAFPDTPGRSIAVLDGTIYVGTSSSDL